MIIIVLVIIGVGLVIGTIAGLGAALGKPSELRKAPAGSVRVESVKAYAVNGEVRRYAQAGWRVVDQTSAKSFGSQARVTLTFRKG